MQFNLSEREAERANRFINKHSSHGETVSYTFVSTKDNMRALVKIRCNSCGKSENITEFT